MVDTFHSGAGFEGGDEFAPPDTDISLIAMNLPEACLTASPSTVLGEGPDGTDLAWSANQKSCDAAFAASPHADQPATEHWSINAMTNHAGYLILRLQTYPAWQVKVNGELVRNLPLRADGLMAVPVPKGPVNLTVDWTTTPDIIAGRWLSALALALITALCVLERKLSRPRLI